MKCKMEDLYAEGRMLERCSSYWLFTFTEKCSLQIPLGFVLLVLPKTFSTITTLRIIVFNRSKVNNPCSSRNLFYLSGYILKPVSVSTSQQVQLFYLLSLLQNFLFAFLTDLNRLRKCIDFSLVCEQPLKFVLARDGSSSNSRSPE